MAVRQSNPFESSFENMTTKAAAGTKKIVKAVSDAGSVVAADVKGQLTGDYSQPLIEQVGLSQTNPSQQQQIQQNQQQILNQTRQNLERINAEIKQAREARIKKEQESKRVEEREEQQKKQLEEKKKKEDPMWKKLLKGKMGSREASKNAGG